MARTDLTLQDIVTGGLTPAYSAANADGHAFLNRGDEFLHIKNGGASPITATLVTPTTVGGRAVADDAIAIPAGGERMIGPLDPQIFAHRSGADTNKAHVDLSDVTSVTIGAFRFQ